MMLLEMQTEDDIPTNAEVLERLHQWEASKYVGLLARVEEQVIHFQAARRKARKQRTRLGGAGRAPCCWARRGNQSGAGAAAAATAAAAYCAAAWSHGSGG